MNRYSILIVSLALLVLLGGCAPQTAPDTRAADERAIRQSESESSKAAMAKDVERYLSAYVDDALLLGPGAPIIAGKEAIRKGTVAFFATPGFSLSFEPAKVVVARGGDMAYTHGTYTMTVSDPQGKLLSDKGKYVTIHTKQPDGKWKVAVDIYNSDLPAPVPAK